MLFGKPVNIEPLEPECLLEFVQNKCSELKNSLIAEQVVLSRFRFRFHLFESLPCNNRMRRWIPECHSILLRLKATWMPMVPLKHGESLQQIRRFFRCITGLISIQIRHLLYDWLKEWQSLIELYKATTLYSTHTRSRYAIYYFNGDQ